MIIKVFIPHILLALFLTMFSSNAFAVTCNEMSSGLRKEGDSYYDATVVKPLTESQKNEVKRVFSSVKTRLSGEGVFIECKGSSNNQRKVIKKERVTGKFNIKSDASIAINLSVHDVENRSSANETLNYFSRKDGYSLVNITSNSITLSRRYRGRPGGKARVFIESIVKLSLSNGVLTIDNKQYFNGYFAYSYTRRLGR